MEKKTIQEIASILVEKNGLQQRDAEQFSIAMFSIIREGLEREGQVKVRGLGTFKIIGVEARESVSVMTGERVLIQGHDKITFTPDATMKELVNKPFSQFETVVLNEGVVFDDMGEEPKATTIKESFVTVPVQESEPMLEEPVSEEPIVVEEEPQPEEPVVEEEPQPEEPDVTAVEEKQETEDIPEAPPMEEVQKQPQPPVAQAVSETNYDDAEENKRNWWPWILLTLLLMAASAAAGYYFGWQQGSKEIEIAEVIDVPAVTVDSTAVDSTTIDSIAVEPVMSDSLLTDSAKLAKQPIQPAASEIHPPKDIKEKPVPTKEVEDKYVKADPRLRYGAYRIVGEDYTIKVRPGETLARLAKRTLGPDMECYIEAFNGIMSNAELKEGQVIKVPKLELKKKKR